MDGLARKWGSRLKTPPIAKPVIVADQRRVFKPKLSSAAVTIDVIAFRISAGRGNPCVKAAHALRGSVAGCWNIVVLSLGER
jgi:hypothetical protein